MSALSPAAALRPLTGPSLQRGFRYATAGAAQCMRHAGHHCASRPSRRRSRPAPIRAQLVDPRAAGKRLVVTPPKLDPSKLEDVRRAEAFGPRGLLLIGMDDKDCAAVQRWFEQMEAGCVVSCCPAALLADGTLRQAVQDGDVLPERPWQQHPPETPPIAFFSGMSGEEQVALIEGWAEHTGLEAPAFASVTPAILDKQLHKLAADIVRAQAQQPPPGYDPEVVAAVQQAASAAGTDATAAGATAARGGEQQLRTKLQDIVMLDGEQGEAPVSLDALKQQINEKMQQKRAAAAEAERQARRAANQDDTDKLRAALRGGKQQGGKKKKGGSGSKGFGSK